MVGLDIFIIIEIIKNICTDVSRVVCALSTRSLYCVVIMVFDIHLAFFQSMFNI